MKKFMIINEEKASDVLDWIRSGKIDRTKRLTNKIKEIVVAGGDGTLLGAIRKYYQRNIPFFGINRGTEGFLLNPIRTVDEYFEAINDYYTISLNLLKVRFVYKNGKYLDTVAFNDVYFKNMILQSGLQGIIKCYGDFVREFDGDGIIVSTAQGSTAYTGSAGGNILSLKDQRILAVTTICAFTKNIKDITTANEIEINFQRGKIAGIADNKIVKNIERAEILVVQDAVKLAFMKGYDFEVMRYRLKK